MTTTTEEHRRGYLRTLLALAASMLALAAAVPAAATADTVWEAYPYWAPTAMQPGERGGFVIDIGNAGDTISDGWPTVEIELPEGVTLDEFDPVQETWSCVGAGTPQTITCTSAYEANPEIPPFLYPFFSAKPGGYLPSNGIQSGGLSFSLKLTVDIAPAAPTGLQPLTITMSGGGAGAPTVIDEQLQIGGPDGFGLREGTLKAEALDSEGDPYTQAGGHPHLAIAAFRPRFKFNDPELPGQNFDASIVEQVAPIKDVIVDAPSGFTGDPLAAPTCTTFKVATHACPPETQVGVVEANQLALPAKQTWGLYSVDPPKGSPAQLAFFSDGGPVVLTPVLRSDGGWGLSVQTKGITEANPVFGFEARIWGVPADESHDKERCERPSHFGSSCLGYDPSGEAPVVPDYHEPHPSTAPRRALLTMPTECDGLPEVTTQHMSSWLEPGAYQPDGDPDLTDSDWKSYSTEAPPIDGCEGLEFEPTLKARPTTNAADSPTGLEVDLHVPQNMDPDGLATAHLKKTVVTLPEGIVVNAASANGLEACSPSQIHLGDRLPDDCPEASKVGTVSVETPILEDPIPGAVYVATPHDNPFGSLLALYIALDDPKTGTIGKIAGKVTPDPQTGQLTATFDDNPQLPFEDLNLDFFGGAAASLKTPATCGAYSTEYELTPWSAPHTGAPVSAEDNWEITQGPNGGSCSGSPGALPHAPSMDAGSTAPIAGANTDFVVNLRREDGTQQFAAVTVTPPPGLVAKLAGTPYCPEAALAAAANRDGEVEKAMPSCPAASEVGDVSAGAGAGPAPYHAHGKVYLAGPYKGAPLSLAIVTPAVAGPFDLGTIVVRTALRVDSRTAQISAVSDPIPHILEGIPLNVKAVSIRIDKPDFALNPTSCRETAVTGSLLSTQGANAALSNRFQLGECGRLGFKPQLKLSLTGGTRRSKFPALTAVLTNRPGDANIASVSVAFPPSEFVAQQHLDDVCTRVQFAADSCPSTSVYGTATVTTPLLDYPLSGAVHLRSSNNTLPDLVPDLRGPAHQPIRLESAGRVDSFRKGIRNTFDFVPDAPFTQLVLKMKGGEKGLLENSRNICARPYRALVKFTAHNGRRYVQRPLIRVKCGKKGQSGKKGRNGAQGKSRSTR